jgi:hypothetical protein
MLKKLLNKSLLGYVLIIGALFRLSLFVVSPPSNSYDDHMEVIKLYAESGERPQPFRCWECYQPPAYYFIGAVVYKLSKSVSDNNLWVWKMVQLINPILSIFVLFLFYKLLLRYNLNDQRGVLYLSFLAVLPRDIFTSSMIGNDYLLVFATAAAIFYYLKILDSLGKNNKISFAAFGLHSFFVALGVLSKQHGLLLLILPFSIVLYSIINRRREVLTKLLPILILIILISFSEEYWKYDNTGKLLVSNQDFFNYAQGQFPGSVDLVEFQTFRIMSLFQTPFISDKTAASIFTELFARTFFDYENRFLSPKIPFANQIGRFAYALGAIWMLFFISTIFLAARKYCRKRHNLTYTHFGLIVLSILGFLFVIVPFIQTYRFPYFSSMKSMFMLPGILVLISVHAFATKKVNIPLKVSSILVGLNILYGLILIITISIVIGSILNHLNGPQWSFP